MTKCKDLQGLYHTLDLKNESVWLCVVQQKKCVSDMQKARENKGKDGFSKNVLLPDLKKVLSLSGQNKPVVSEHNSNFQMCTPSSQIMAQNTQTSYTHCKNQQNLTPCFAVNVTKREKFVTCSCISVLTIAWQPV